VVEIHSTGMRVMLLVLAECRLSVVER